MADNSPNTPQGNEPASPVSPPLSEPQDWRDELRQARRAARREAHDLRHSARDSAHSGWIWGLFFIVAGALLLLQTYRLVQLTNLWAFFLLIPACGAFAEAWAHYQSQGRVTRHVRSALLTGFVFGCAAALLLFGFYLAQIWPLLLIVAGAAILINALLPE
jgi:hypothetical protein